MNGPPKFDCCVIMKNAAKTLPRLFASLDEYIKRQGRIIIVDTGSTDGSGDLARSYGAEVTYAGERFMREIDVETAGWINDQFVVPPDTPIVNALDRLFHSPPAPNPTSALPHPNHAHWLS